MVWNILFYTKMAIIYLLRLLDPNHQYIKIGILSQKTIKEIHHFEENEYIPYNHVIPHIKDYLLIYKGIFPFDNQDYQHIFEKKDNIKFLLFSCNNSYGINFGIV